MGEAALTMSERESEVLAAVADHLTNAEIGRRLHISVRTVESHVSSLLRKLGVPDRRALARYGNDLAEGAASGTQGVAPGLQGAPAALTSFIGRQTELSAVSGALAEARLVNLVGPGGVGKTRLGVEATAAAAPRFPGGAWFVDLVPVRSGGVATAVAAAVGLVDRPNRSLEEVIEEFLRPRQALLVVDNCEHVLEAVAPLVERLLVACPGLRVVATSRELLGVTGERVVPVTPLAEADAVRLFVERVRSLDPAFAAESESDRDAAADVCARLDGIPLAIELASARCAVLGLDGVRAGLGDRLRILDMSGRRADERHRSLREVLDWSHGLLDATEQTVLRRLAVFAGDFTTADAAAVVSEGPGRPVGEAEAVEAIARLTAKSLLVRRTGGGTSVYRLLETVHEYAGERLAESGEAEAVRRRHMAWAHAAVAAAERRLIDRGDWRDRFDAIADDVRVALGWVAAAAPPTAGPVPVADRADLADRLGAVAGGGAGGARGADRAVRAGEVAGGPPEDRAGGTGGVDPAEADAHGLARSYAHLAYARRFLSEAQATYQLAASLAGDDHGAAAADLRLAGATAYARMRGDLAYQNYLAAADRGERPGADPAAAAKALAEAATVAWRCPAEFPEARPREEVVGLLARARQLDPGDDPEVAAYLAVAGAWVACETPAGADLALSRAAVAACRAVGDLPLLSVALDAEIAGLWEEGRVGEAVRVAGERLELLDRFARDDPRTGGEVIDIFHMAADTALGAGRCREALDHAALMRKDEMGETSPHAATREAVVALTLLGRLTEAIAEADSMRRDWERAGRPEAAWMTPAATAAELAHALLGDRQAAAEWAVVTQQVAGASPPRSANRAFMAFASARAAFHDGRVDDAVAAIAAWDRTVASGYLGYAVGLEAELAVVAGLDDAAARIAAARDLVDENAWGLACLLRAEARLTGDPATLRAALDAFDEIDARFEWAITALLGDEPLAAEGRSVLADMGAAPPPD